MFPFDDVIMTIENTTLVLANKTTKMVACQLICDAFKNIPD